MSVSHMIKNVGESDTVQSLLLLPCLAVNLSVKVAPA